MSKNPEMKRALVTLGGIVVAVSLPLAACAPGPALPVEQKAVEIACIATLTGPTATSGQINTMAMQDYIDLFNEREGIPEVTVKLLWADSGLEIARFASAYRRFVQRGVPIYYSDDTINMWKLRPEIEKNETPFLTWVGASTVLVPPGWIFGFNPMFSETFTAVLDYFNDNWKEDRPPRVLFAGGENFLGRGAADECAPYVEQIGMEMLPFEMVPFVVLDATPMLLRARETGADLVILGNTVPATGAILNDADRLGLTQTIQFAGAEFTLGQTLVDMVGPALEGYIAPRTTPLYDDSDVPGIQMIIDAQIERHGKVERQPEYINGWLGGAVMCEVLNRAIDDVGLEELDGVAVKREYESLKDFDVDGIIKVTYGPERRRGTLMVSTYMVQGGEMVRVSDWREVPILAR